MKMTIESAGRISLDEQAKRELGLQPGDQLVLEKAETGWTLRPTDPKEDASRALRERFRRLAATWKAETGHLSSTARTEKHPAYQEIVRIGSPAVPLLLEELQREPDFWFGALRAVTGENPVPASSAGKIDKMAQAWLDWGRARGLIK